MASERKDTVNSPLIVIIGETASGKSALGMALAEEYNGEIIAADSRTVYTGMDIGTAKPSKQDQAKIPHYLIDIVPPGVAFNASDFQTQAREAMDTITKRNKLPIMVGGTGLYVDSLLYDFTFRPPADPAFRTKLEQSNVEELQAMVTERGLELPENDRNPRHLTRILETNGTNAVRQSLREATLVLGMKVEPDRLADRIAKRVDDMFNAGLEVEVRMLSEQFGWDAEAMKAVGYREWKLYFDGDASLEEVRTQIIKNTQSYAKRQRTWFKRNTDIVWISSLDEAQDHVADFLHN